MKAWIVYNKDDDEEWSFVLAETRDKAKYKGKMNLLWSEWTQLRVRREPGLDGVEHPTDKDWYDRTGRYAYACSSCGDYLDTSGDDLFVFSESGYIYHKDCFEEENYSWQKACNEFAEFMEAREVDEMSILAMREIMEDL